MEIVSQTGKVIRYQQCVLFCILGVQGDDETDIVHLKLSIEKMFQNGDCYETYGNN